MRITRIFGGSADYARVRRGYGEVSPQLALPREREIWTVAGGPGYTGKLRPAVILQDDAFDATASITICPFTTYAVDAPLIRLPVVPSERRAESHLMIDKITTISRKKLESRVGRLSAEDIVRVNRAVVVFLSLAGPGTKLSF